MSQPPVHPSSGYPNSDDDRPYPGYGQAGAQPRYQDSGQPSYPGYGQPSYQDSGQQSYPGYGQPSYQDGGQQPYPGYGQPPSYQGTGQQSYPGYGQPSYQDGGQQTYPGYGQPPGQPSYQDGGQPSYPGYGPAAGQSYPGYSEPSYPGYSRTATAPPPKKSKAGKIVLIVLAVVVLLCGGGSAVAYYALKDDVDAAVEASKTRLVAPETLAGRPKIKDAELQALADAMVADMKKDIPSATSTIGAFYGNPAKKDMVMVAGASAPVADPAKELEEALTGLGGDLKVTNFKSVEPGPLGGVAKCGDGDADGAPVGLCVWADKGSVGVIGVFFKTGDQAKAELVKIRGEVTKRQ